MNLTPINATINKIMFTPDKNCFDWCIVQHVIHSNNMEINAIIIIIFTYFMIVLHNISNEINILRPYKETFLYWAKLSLIIFFGFYILIIRMRILW